MEKPMGIDDVAEFLGVSESTVRNYCDPEKSDNPLPCHQPIENRKVFVIPSELERWMRSREPQKPNVPLPPTPGEQRRKTRKSLEFRTQLSYD